LRSSQITGYTEAIGLLPEITHGMLTCLYFSIITFTTTGYGDIVPATFESRYWAAAEAVAGYSVMALSISAIVALFQRFLPEALVAPERSSSLEGS
jgi:voltage-gated potassium channel Kch